MHTLLLVCLVRELPIYTSNAFEDNFGSATNADNTSNTYVPT